MKYIENAEYNGGKIAKTLTNKYAYIKNGVQSKLYDSIEELKENTKESKAQTGVKKAVEGVSKTSTGSTGNDTTKEAPKKRGRKAKVQTKTVDTEAKK